MKSVSFPCIKVAQPIGTFYVGAIPHNELVTITFVDVRRITQREIETFSGIQRPLNEDRVRELQTYVRSPDACFPTAVILAVPQACVSFNEKSSVMTLQEYVDPDEPTASVPYDRIAKVIDGQHRIAGLKSFEAGTFDVNVSLFVDMEVSDQAYVFSTVNLAQTKVNRSLAYDLYDLAKSRSPQKTCHEIAVALDRHEDSPFHQRIKRLGVATEGRYGERITQATFVESLLPYVSTTPSEDRSAYLKRRKPAMVSADESNRLIFRNMFIQEKDLEITDVIWNFFQAVKETWPEAWSSNARGLILSRTNGFRAFMRLLRPAYLYLGAPGDVPKKAAFAKLLAKATIKDEGFTTDEYSPGASGEAKLFRALRAQLGLEGLG